MKIYAVQIMGYEGLEYQKLFLTKELAEKHIEELKEEARQDYKKSKRLQGKFKEIGDYVEIMTYEYSISELEVSE